MTSWTDESRGRLEDSLAGRRIDLPRQSEMLRRAEQDIADQRAQGDEPLAGDVEYAEKLRDLLATSQRHIAEIEAELRSRDG